MKKVVLLVCGASAAISMVVIGSGHAGADVPDVTGETYGKAVAILKSQGIKPSSAARSAATCPQSQCTVSQQISSPRHKIKLMLDCTLPEGADKPGAPTPIRWCRPADRFPMRATGPPPVPAR